MRFYYKDFQDISIPEADLSGTIAFETNFSRAGLSQVNFGGAYLYGSCFKDAKFTNMYLGEYPAIETENLIHSACYSPDDYMIAATSDKKIILYDSGNS